MNFIAMMMQGPIRIRRLRRRKDRYSWEAKRPQRLLSVEREPSRGSKFKRRRKKRRRSKVFLNKYASTRTEPKMPDEEFIEGFSIRCYATLDELPSNSAHPTVSLSKHMSSHGNTMSRFTDDDNGYLGQSELSSNGDKSSSGSSVFKVKPRDILLPKAKNFTFFSHLSGASSRNKECATDFPERQTDTNPVTSPPTSHATHRTTPHGPTNPRSGKHKLLNRLLDSDSPGFPQPTRPRYSYPGVHSDAAAPPPRSTNHRKAFHTTFTQSCDVPSAFSGKQLNAPRAEIDGQFNPPIPKAEIHQHMHQHTHQHSISALPCSKPQPYPPNPAHFSQPLPHPPNPTHFSQPLPHPKQSASFHTSLQSLPNQHELSNSSVYGQRAAPPYIPMGQSSMTRFAVPADFQGFKRPVYTPRSLVPRGGMNSLHRPSIQGRSLGGIKDPCSGGAIGGQHSNMKLSRNVMEQGDFREVPHDRSRVQVSHRSSLRCNDNRSRSRSPIRHQPGTIHLASHATPSLNPSSRVRPSGPAGPLFPEALHGSVRSCDGEPAHHFIPTINIPSRRGTNSSYVPPNQDHSQVARIHQSSGTFVGQHPNMVLPRDTKEQGYSKEVPHERSRPQVRQQSRLRCQNDRAWTRSFLPPQYSSAPRPTVYSSNPVGPIPSEAMHGLMPAYYTDPHNLPRYNTDPHVVPRYGTNPHLLPRCDTSPQFFPRYAADPCPLHHGQMTGLPLSRDRSQPAASLYHPLLDVNPSLPQAVPQQPTLCRRTGWYTPLQHPVCPNLPPHLPRTHHPPNP